MAALVDSDLLDLVLDHKGGRTVRNPVSVRFGEVPDKFTLENNWCLAEVYLRNKRSKTQIFFGEDFDEASFGFGVTISCLFYILFSVLLTGSVCFPVSDFGSEVCKTTSFLNHFLVHMLWWLRFS